jgi:hypothetical protein
LLSSLTCCTLFTLSTCLGSLEFEAWDFRFWEIAYGLHASVLRICLAFVTMESVDTIHVISDNEAACMHVGAARIENVSFSCGGTKVDTNTEVTGSIAQRFTDVNVHLGEAVVVEE